MIAVEQLTAMKTHTRLPYRALCARADVPYSSFMRWRGRVERGESVVKKPGPKPLAALDASRLNARLHSLNHRTHRSFGAPALWHEHRNEISRRDFAQLVADARSQTTREALASQRRVQWKPGLVWSFDETQFILQRDGGRMRRLHLLSVQDLGSRYKFPPAATANVSGAWTAAHLVKLFAQHGAPLVLKRDNGSALNCVEVNALLQKHLVIPLNSPPRLPRYNGGIERAQREIKASLRNFATAEFIAAAPEAAAAIAVDHLNHCPRRCLRGQTACEIFCRAKTNLRAYTRAQRKEAFAAITELADNILTSPVSTQIQRNATRRHAVEIWLQQQEILTIQPPNRVTPFPKNSVS